MPFIYQRFIAYPRLDQVLGLNKGVQGKVPGGVLKALQSFYYDTAQSAHPMAMKPLANLVSARRSSLGPIFLSEPPATTSRALPAASSTQKILRSFIAATPCS